MPEDRINLGRPDADTLRDFEAQGLDLGADLSWNPGDRNGLTLGVDLTRTRLQLPSYSLLYREGARAGEKVPDGPPGGMEELANLGLYAQGSWYPWEPLGITANLRGDAHNVYGNQPSSRLGLVYQLSPELTAKALYGSAFKAPSPPQLFGRPLAFGDILGNRSLRPEYAATYELGLGYAPGRHVELGASAYYTHVEDRVAFETRDGNRVAVNLGQLEAAGLEASLKWRWRGLHAFLNGSLQRTQPTNLGPDRDPTLEREPYPSMAANAGLGGPLGPASLFGEARFVGPLPATQAHVASGGGLSYELPQALVLDLHLSNTDPFLLGGRDTYLSLRVANLLDAAYTYPGYGGLDYPGLGRTLSLRLVQGF